MIDENDFFRQVTTRVCGSLDIKTALARAFQYLRDFIPLDAMGLHLYEPELDVMRTIARVSASGSFVVDKVTPLHGKLKESSEPVKIVNHPERDLLVKTMIRHGKPSESSVMLLYLVMGQDRGGALSMRADGKNKYREEHAHLLSLVAEPFTIALDNALKHRELVQSQRPAGGRQPLPAERTAGYLRRQNHRREFGIERHYGHGPAGGAAYQSCAAFGRNRYRQRCDCQCHSLFIQTQGRPLHQGELRRHSRYASGQRTFRT